MTTAVNNPALSGLVEKVTTKLVAVAEVTVPTAPLLKVTVLLPAVVLKPKPLMVTVVAFNAKLLVLAVTTGRTSATCTAEPLFTPLVVTMAVKEPATAGLAENNTVNEVDVEAVTAPTTPLLNTTVLLPGVELNPVPVSVIELEFAFKLAVELVTETGTVAT